MSSESRTPNPHATSENSTSRPTVIDAPYVRAARAGEVGDGQNSYMGRRIHALTGLHEHMAQELRQSVESGCRVLDLAAGSGAFARRLADAGFHVTAVDYVRENFQGGDDIKFVQADLNGAFSRVTGAGFDAIVAMEIIEHLENPRHFLRECVAAIKPGGTIFLSTPNLESPLSKAMYIRTSRHQWFSDEDYVRQGHINPVSPWALRHMIEECGLVVSRWSSFGDPFSGAAAWPRMRWLGKIVSWLDSSNSEKGEILVVQVIAPASDRASIAR